jgi:hypothetical protein
MYRAEIVGTNACATRDLDTFRPFLTRRSLESALKRLIGAVDSVRAAD